MNSKMTTNSQLSTSEPKKHKNKNKLSKQLEQDSGEEKRGEWGKGKESKKHKW